MRNAQSGPKSCHALPGNRDKDIKVVHVLADNKPDNTLECSVGRSVLTTY